MFAQARAEFKPSNDFKKAANKVVSLNQRISKAKAVVADLEAKKAALVEFLKTEILDYEALTEAEFQKIIAENPDALAAFVDWLDTNKNAKGTPDVIVDKVATGNARITFNNSISNTFQQSELKVARPDIYAEFCKPQVKPRMTIN